LGTSGTGKSFFTIFWACYLAIKRKRIVWKLASGSCYLPNFSQGAITAQGSVDTLNHFGLQEVLRDANS
jgi:hypothetical protein